MHVSAREKGCVLVVAKGSQFPVKPPASARAPQIDRGTCMLFPLRFVSRPSAALQKALRQRYVTYQHDHWWTGESLSGSHIVS